MFYMIRTAPLDSLEPFVCYKTKARYGGMIKKEMIKKDTRAVIFNISHKFSFID